MSRLLRVLVVVLAVVPAVGVLVAVQATPRSAYSLPRFEINTRSGPIRLTADDLGAYRTAHGVGVDESAMSQTIDRLAALFRMPATADAYALENGRVVLHPGHGGVELDKRATRSLLLQMVHGETTSLSLPLRNVDPSAAPPDAIVVNLSKFRLDLYQRTRLVDHFPVGVGRLRFATPPGVYFVRYKEKNPAWRNPGSSWARSMPWYMPPGPQNPLGTRALGLDRGALVIHGTPEPWTIGSRSSHGCIRMRRHDVERLFDLVPRGTPVFIVP
jgi:lipoprotein-anchoring transpeptidase ErfK/SrfK